MSKPFRTPNGPTPIDMQFEPGDSMGGTAPMSEPTDDELRVLLLAYGDLPPTVAIKRRELLDALLDIERIGRISASLHTGEHFGLPASEPCPCAMCKALARVDAVCAAHGGVAGTEHEG